MAPGIFAQVVFQPVHRFSIEMVGRFVEQQKIRLRQQQLGEGHAAALTTRQLAHIRIRRRAAQGIHRLLHLRVQVPQVLRVDHILQLGGLVGVLVGIVHHQGVVFVENGLLGGHAFHHVLENILVRVEMRFLFEISAGGPIGEPRLTVPLLVEPRHDAQKRRLA